MITLEMESDVIESATFYKANMSSKYKKINIDKVTAENEKTQQ